MDLQKIATFRKVGLPAFMALLLILSLAAAFGVKAAAKARDIKMATHSLDKQIQSMGFKAIDPASVRLGSIVPQMAWAQGTASSDRMMVYRFAMPLPSPADRQTMHVMCSKIYAELVAQVPKLKNGGYQRYKDRQGRTVYIFSGMNSNQPGFALLGAINNGGTINAISCSGTGVPAGDQLAIFPYLLAGLSQIPR